MAFDPIRHFQQFDFRSCRHVLVAVSGGSDSLGLLIALHTYLNTKTDRPKLSAVTIDHNLREGSAAEAQGVADLCRTLQIPHTMRIWTEAKPNSAIQASARYARRALICEAAGDIGADVILTGHTLDDQLETIVMRQKRAVGPGLAGIAKASLAYNDRGDGSPIWIMRPLLKCTRRSIRDYLLGMSVSWVDDPSNENLSFERIVVRKELMAYDDAQKELLLKTSNAAALAREGLATQAGHLLRRFVSEVTPGLVHVDNAAFASTNTAALLVLLRTLIAFAGGAAGLGDDSVCQAIVDKVGSSGLSSGTKPWRVTSNGAVIEARTNGVYLMREARSVPARQVDYDGRYRATAAGRRVSLAMLQTNDIDMPASLVRHANALEPVFQTREKVALPAYEAAQQGFPLRRLINPWPDLIPSFDLELAKYLSLMARAGDISDPPIYFP